MTTTAARLASVALVFASSGAFAAEPAVPVTRATDVVPDEPLGPAFHPEGPGTGRLRVALGASVDILPRRVSESEQRPFPLLTASVRYGLPRGFSVDARASAIYVSNHVELGATYARRFGPVAVGVQNHAGVWVGALGVSGFDAFGWSLIDEPGLALGIDIGSSRLTLTEEALFALAKHTTLGDATKSTGGGSPFAGLLSTLLVESPVGKHGELFYGVGVFWVRPQYEAWIAFSDQRAHTVYPRLMGGYAF